MSTEPLAGRRAARLPAPGRYPCGLTWDGTHLWHSDQEAARIYAIDRADGTVVCSFSCAHVRADLAYDTAMLCQIGGRPKRLVLIDPTTGEVAGSRPILPANGRPTGAEFGPQGLWLLLRGPNVVQLRTHPGMGLVREYAVPGSSPSGLTYANGFIVFGDFEAATLYVIDAGTGEHVRSVALDAPPTGITTDGELLWYCDFRGRTFRALDLADIGASSTP